MKKTLILSIIWIVVGLIGSHALQTQNYGLFFICAVIHPILSIILFFRLFGVIGDIIRSIFSAKKKRTFVDEETIDEDNVEEITFDHPDYIGIMTKINKKKNYGRKRK